MATGTGSFERTESLVRVEHLQLKASDLTLPTTVMGTIEIKELVIKTTVQPTGVRDGDSVVFPPGAVQLVLQLTRPDQREPSYVGGPLSEPVLGQLIGDDRLVVSVPEVPWLDSTGLTLMIDREPAQR